ncbi:RICIN domain-containing protein [Streptomyces sp. SYP-A7185]|uniref:RICIN domain-containing protein n=1 Tax=Streptomyces sp. SYP-A7185 TaxID=3040076 RepID=UPI0038F5D222
MSEIDEDDAKRRQRARFVDALTTNAQQPGERSRLGSRVTGAVAVLALAAGATLGLGAWRSYQADENDKKLKLAAEQSVAEKKSPRPSSPRPKPEATQQNKKQPPGPGAIAERPAEPSGGVAPSASSEKKQKKSKEGEPSSDSGEVSARTLTTGERLGILLKNASTGMCADIPYYKAGSVGKGVSQYHCDGTDEDNQIWNMRVRYAGKGPGGSDLVSFGNVKDHLCIDLPERGSQRAGTKLSEGRCNTIPSDNQLYWLQSAGDGAVWIRNYASNDLCLQVYGAEPRVAGTRLAIGTCTNGDSRWRLINT